MDENIRTRVGFYINTYTADGAIDVYVCLSDYYDNFSEVDNNLDEVENVIKRFINREIDKKTMELELEKIYSWGCEVIVRFHPYNNKRNVL